MYLDLWSLANSYEAQQTVVFLDKAKPKVWNRRKNCGLVLLVKETGNMTILSEQTALSRGTIFFFQKKEEDGEGKANDGREHII